MIRNLSIDQKESSYGQSILSELGLRVDDLIGRRVLDLGAGSAAFAKYVNQFGCECISLDEDYINDGKRNNKKANMVNSVAENLPFQDSTFHFVVSKMGIPMLSGVRTSFINKPSGLEYRIFEEEMEKHISEIKRVIKPGGEFRIFPVELQFLANETYALSGKNSTDEEFNLDMDIMLRRSFEQYKKHGLTGAKLIKNDDGQSYLSWVKPLR